MQEAARITMRKTVKSQNDEMQEFIYTEFFSYLRLQGLSSDVMITVPNFIRLLKYGDEGK